MDKDQKIVKLKLDVIFKRIFGVDSNKRIVRAFVSDLLDLPLESVRSVSIENVEIAPETLNQKFSRLDLSSTSTAESSTLKCRAISWR